MRSALADAEVEAPLELASLDLGREREARFQWRRALSFDPEDKEEVRIRRKLEVGLDAVLTEEKELETASGND